MNDDGPVTESPWTGLRKLTAARIALGRAGAGLPTAAHLDFQQAHALARDAVHLPLDRDDLAARLSVRGFEPVAVESAARDRATYLQRPDLGRLLSDASVQKVEGLAGTAPEICFVIADGLSATAVARHAEPMLAAATAGLGLEPGKVALFIALQGRVALIDAIGGLVGARFGVMLIGERPGLSSPDSLGLYLTMNPRPGRTDAERNCLSNIRPGGMRFEEAAHRLVWLVGEAKKLGGTGVALKDASERLVLSEGGRNFLLPTA
ncbi:MAG: ethanolamine ammonia-lyase subunit EutC [Rhodospirillales bacterium]